MKKKFLIWIIFFLYNSLLMAQYSDYKFTQIRPLLDNMGKLHIIYRLHYYAYYGTDSYNYNSIYYIDRDRDRDVDSLLIRSYNFSSPLFWYYNSVNDYTFINNELRKFIYIEVGGYLFDIFYSIIRFDGNTSYYQGGGLISIQRHNLLDNFLYAWGAPMYVSYDQGLNWELKSNNYSKITNDPFRLGTYYFAFNNLLYKTNDDWNTITLSDSNNIFTSSMSRILFDMDSTHIYYMSYGGVLRRSWNNGELNSWETIFAGTNGSELCTHDTISGIVYCSVESELKRSKDFGDSFDTYISLDEKIIDLYHQTVEGNIYIATDSKLIIINSDKINIIKDISAISIVNGDFLPIEYSLTQNYPNPFNPNTIIKYTIPELRFTTLKVFDVLGNEIATLVNEEKPAGTYEVEFNPVSGIRNPASGIYFYQLKAGDYVETKKMILLK